MSETRPNRSVPGSIGAGLGSMARHALNPKARSKVLRAAGVGLGTTAKAVQRTTHILWLEITGFFFLVFATVCASAGWHEYRLSVEGKAPLSRVYLAGAIALLFVWFGISSFIRARRR